MKEVSCRSVRVMIDALPALGVDRHAILKEARLDSEIFEQDPSYISWSEFVRLHRAVGKALGSEERLVELGRRMMDKPSEVPALRLLSLLTHPKLLYEAAIRWHGPQDFLGVQASLENLSRDKIRIRVWLQPPMEDCPEFFRIIQGVYERYPTIIGLAPSIVETEADPRQCQFTLTLPPSKSVFSRAKHAWAAVKDSALLSDELQRMHTQSIRSYEELRATRKDFLRIIENSPDGFFIHRKGVILYANPRLGKSLGLSPHRELIGRKLTEFIHPSDKIPLQAYLHRALESELREFRFLARNGDEITLEFASREDISFDDAPASLVSARDTTERNLAELRMVEQQKLAALGEMAAEIAHDIRNPLAAIDMGNQLIQKLLLDGGNSDPRIRGLHENIQSNSERIQKIILGLTRFTRNSSQDPMTRTRVEDVLHDAIGLCQEQLRKNSIQLTVSATDSSLAIECRPIEICQILVNLLNNSIDALRAQSDRWIRIQVAADLESIRIRVTDSGSIPSCLKDKLFESFFTTKPPGHGTGLGLSISRRIAEQHQGALTLEETQPHTSFVLKLPRAIAPEAHLERPTGIART